MVTELVHTLNEDTEVNKGKVCFDYCLLRFRPSPHLPPSLLHTTLTIKLASAFGLASTYNINRLQFAVNLALLTFIFFVSSQSFI
jgi:hypothetical protein